MSGPHYGDCAVCGCIAWLGQIRPDACSRCGRAALAAGRVVPVERTPENVRAELQSAGWKLIHARRLDDPLSDESRRAPHWRHDVTDHDEPADVRPRPLPRVDHVEPALVSAVHGWALEHALEGELDAFELMTRPKSYGRRRMPHRENTDISVRSTRFGLRSEVPEGADSVGRGQVFQSRQ